ncbi:hypothetical protein [Micromonospora sagamiensis]|uniref:PPE family protein n=1 Tax=Micromonospora sagamiensis TaxID=47875 RepID=A0A562WMD8_9ACTN|nr:hypothetical protein [Micromonospora sagamiensis]TWJ31315.1 hypothetical protein JD81_04870 [Micromonospora sagamiensis]BCL15640.1 hypothetical protein GCM10017556_33790 [Micromonospora sagamiensis]
MIEQGGGPTSGLTNWHNMDVATMWATLQDHQTDNHWRQVAGWRKTSELAQTHLSRLREYWRGLAQAWPPEKSAASRTYLAELDQLIDTVQQTYDAAVANYTALSAATSAIGSTRTELKKLHDRYAEKVRLKQAYEATLDQRPLHRVGRSTPARPPVTDSELEQLNGQARNLMYGLSGELQQAQAMLKPPPPAPTRPIRQDSNPDIYAAGSAPVIPPIVPVPLPASGATGPIDKSSKAARPMPMPTAPGLGPILGGAGPNVLPPQTNPTTPPVTPPMPPSNPGVVPLPPVSAPPPRNPLGAPGRGGAAGPVGKPPAGGPAAGPRPLPPGGLIGGTPGMGLGQPAPGAPAPRRVNPIGGVIGGGGAGTAPSGGAGSRPGSGRGPSISGMHGMSPFGGPPGLAGQAGRPGRREPDELDPRRWDPNNPWETAQGVDPVVRPPDEEGPIDPGPAIGLDR